ncbi:endonuclease/exonuclease/phosphatase, partial [Nitritalea halalkaliphila LW7]
MAANGTFRVTNFFPGNQPITFTGVVRASGEAGIPFISTDPEALGFPRTSIREEGPVLSYILSARDLQGPVEISGPEVLRFSLDGSNFQAPLSIPAESLEAEALTLFVQFSSAEAINLASSIQHSTSGIPPVSLAVTGQRFDPFQIFEDFNTSCQEGLPDGWTAIAITGQQLWECTQFGRAGNNATANAPFGLQANGFANGTQQTNEQWLISPAFDL